MNRKSKPFPFPNHLPPQAVLVLFDCLSNLVEAAWQQYEPILLDLILQDLHVPPDDNGKPEFDDEI